MTLNSGIDPHSENQKMNEEYLGFDYEFDYTLQENFEEILHEMVDEDYNYTGYIDPAAVRGTLFTQLAYELFVNLECKPDKEYSHEKLAKRLTKAFKFLCTPDPDPQTEFDNVLNRIEEYYFDTISVETINGTEIRTLKMKPDALKIYPFLTPYYPVS